MTDCAARIVHSNKITQKPMTEQQQRKIQYIERSEQKKKGY